jgi:DNA-binding MarR family transcriptional regulator
MERGLSRLQGFILRATWQRARSGKAPGGRADLLHRHLRRRLRLDDGTDFVDISRAARRLEKRGLVLRIRGDRRGPAGINLTAKGAALGATLPPAHLLCAEFLKHRRKNEPKKPSRVRR